MLRRIILSLALPLLPLAAGADCMGPYPPSMVKAYTQNCAQDPKSQPFCKCMIDEVQRTIPLAEFIEMSNTEGTLAADRRFIAVTKKCTPLMAGGTSAPASQQSFEPQKTKSGATMAPAADKDDDTR